MLFWTFGLSLLTIFVSSSRIYQVSISVQDDVQWNPSNNASVYFILTTNDNGKTRESPAYIIQDGLPQTKIYTYSLLLDDIGDVESLRLMHSDSNTLCIDFISVDNETVLTADNRDYDCSAQQHSECQQITAYFNTKKIVQSPDAEGCDWGTISSLALMREYNILIKLSSIYDTNLFNQIGVSLQGFVFKDYYSPHYNISYDVENNILEHDDGSSQIALTIVTYDVTPIRSLAIANGNEEQICIESASIAVTNYDEMSVDKTLTAPQCIQYSSSETNSGGCNVMDIDFRKDIITTEIQDNCDIRYTSWEYEADHRPETNVYTLNMDVPDDTEDYVFYMMIGHSLVHLNLYFYLYLHLHLNTKIQKKTH